MLILLLSAYFHLVRALVKEGMLVLAFCSCSRYIRMAGAGKFIANFFHSIPVSCGASDLAFSGIVESPKRDVVVPLNTNGVFVCKADSTDSDLNWLIGFPGELPLPVDYYAAEQLDARGIVVTTMNNTSTLSISGFPENNNTAVYCALSMSGDTSDEATFIVFGK